MRIEDLKAGFIAHGIPKRLVDEALDSYLEVMRRFALGDFRPEAVEAGRFGEAVMRILQWRTDNGNYTPVGKSLAKFPGLMTKLENVPSSAHPDSIRIHIPRTLQLIYDVRNKRDIAHLGDGIDPNLQDSTLIVANMKWVLAEFVRLYHDIPAAEAQRAIEDVVTKDVPAIQEIGGYPVVLKDLSPRDQRLLLLYKAGATGVSIEDLAADLRTNRRDNLRSSLRTLESKLRYVSNPPGTDDWYITLLGERFVEAEGLALPV